MSTNYRFRSGFIATVIVMTFAASAFTLSISRADSGHSSRATESLALNTASPQALGLTLHVPRGRSGSSNDWIVPYGLNSVSGAEIVRVNYPAPQKLPGLANVTFTVNTAADDDDLSCDSAPGDCTLREAINAANANAGLDTIQFAIGSGTPTINVGSGGLGGLPIITSSVILDGNTGGATRVELSGVGVDPNINGLRITAGGSTVRGLVINRFSAAGIRLETNGGNVIENCYIGTNAAGSAVLGNRNSGIFIIDSPNNTIGGTTPAARNILSGNGRFVEEQSNGLTIFGFASTGNLVEGNFIGTDVTGNSALPNVGAGVFINSGFNNTIGGTTIGARNVISGNGTDGVQIIADSNIVMGNYIGLNVAGSADLGNSLNGIIILNVADNNTIGGTVAGTRNVISGNDLKGISIESFLGVAPTSTLVQGNFIGTDSSGVVDIGNSFEGVLIDNAPSNTIGGTTAEARNVISGNSIGIRISGVNATNNLVRGNYVGTDLSGSSDLGNSSSGAVISGGATANTIGGETTGERNIISGNDGDGVSITGAATTGNFVLGNYIGTDALGNADLGNALEGVGIGSANNTIGGTASGAGNLISGNDFNGVHITGANTTGNLVQGNRIGTNAAGTAAVGNTRDGVFIRSGANNNIIGGTLAGARNIISGNSLSGVEITDGNGMQNLVHGNYIGTNANGTAALGNASDGVLINGAPNNTIGPLNVVSGNQGSGVHLLGSLATGNVVGNNLIGTNATQTADLGNSADGVRITGAPNNIVGSNGLLLGNVISGNDQSGVRITGIGAMGNTLRSNGIGTNGPVTLDLGNSGPGINIEDGASGNNVADSAICGNDADGISIIDATGNTIQSNLIGAAGLGNSGHGLLISGSSNAIGPTNTITFNGKDGVFISSGAFNTIFQNAIFSNTELGIDLEPDSVTANDGCDGDAGANNLQNSPVISSATTSAGATTIQGTLKSTLNTTFIIEFFSNPACDPSGSGEGQTFIGSTTVTTDATCNAVFTKTISPAVAVGQFVTATATEPNKDTSEFSTCRQVLDPTAVEFAAFKATGFDDGVLIEWQTGLEVDNLGFNLYREQDGKRALLNSQLLAGSALIAGPGTVLTAGRSYSWADPLIDNQQGQRYWVEDVDLGGQSTLRGPFAVTHNVIGKKLPSELKRAATLGALGKNQNPEAQTALVEAKTKLSKIEPALLQIQSDLASRPAIKLYLRREGWFRVSADELIRTGLDQASDPRLLQLFADGRELPISVTGENDGRLDPADSVEFYGTGLDSPFSDARAYWLVAGSQPGKRIEKIHERGGQSPSASFACTVERRDRNVYFSALRNGEAENFFGAVVTNNPVDQTINILHLDQTAVGDAKLEVTLQGVTLAEHRVKVSLNGTELSTIVFNGQTQGVAGIELSHALLRDGNNYLQLISLAGSGDVNLVDSIRLTYWRNYRAYNDTLRFTAEGNHQVTIDGFTDSSIRVVDVTSPDAVQEVSGEVSKAIGGYSITFTAPGTGERALVAFASGQTLRPTTMKANDPSSWRRPDRGADLVIISPRDLLNNLNPLAMLRRTQGLSVAMIDVEDICDEFSFGHKTPYAVKDFLSYAIGVWKKSPRFALFAGDASFDPKNYLGHGDFDLVPTKLIDTEFMETASDDWFADFNNDGLAEIAVGRLPARTAQQADAIVAKLIAYERSPISEELTLVADEGFFFEAANDALREQVPSSIRIEEIRRARMDPATAKIKVLEAINRGQKIVNYTGHGSVDLWSGNLLTSGDTGVMANTDRLSVFVMMTCLNGYFHDPALDSLAESLIKTERGAAVAVWTSSAMTYPLAQAVMNQEFYRLILNGAGRSIKLGDVTRRAKSAISDPDIRRTWILIGDPTMALR